MSAETNVEQNIRAKLTAALTPERLAIEDQSDRHQGHSGWREGVASHFHVEIVSGSFEGQPRLARHRRVYEILADELAGDVHALALTTLTPGEAAERG